MFIRNLTSIAASYLFEAVTYVFALITCASVRKVSWMCLCIFCSCGFRTVTGLRPYLLTPPSMFGGVVSISNNSPHLRKSGSRPVVFDIGKRTITFKYLYSQHGMFVVI